MLKLVKKTGAVVVPIVRRKMSNYFDKYGRLHHKPITISDPIPSNNSWLYTAYFAKAGGKVGMTALSYCFNRCRVYYEAKGEYIINRNPGKSSVPFSRDEYLGVVALGLLTGKLNNNWNFCPFKIPRFNPFKLIKQLWELRPSFIEVTTDERLSFMNHFKSKHRNYFWQNNLDQLYRFAFSVPLVDRHFILTKWDKFQWYNPVHIFYKLVAKIDGKFGASGIRWLKYGGEENKLAMVREFPENHPIRIKLGL